MLIRIGTDCSGIEAPIIAFKKLNIPFDHIFSCDYDKHVREAIKANYNPQIIYEDINNRDHQSDFLFCRFSHASRVLEKKDLMIKRNYFSLS